MIRSQDLVAQMDAVERNGANLVVADGKPGRAAADQKAVDADRIDQRHDGGIFDHTEAAPLKVKDLEAEQLGEEQPFVLPLPA